jgi:hypothetical protein
MIDIDTWQQMDTFNYDGVKIKEIIIIDFCLLNVFPWSMWMFVAKAMFVPLKHPTWRLVINGKQSTVNKSLDGSMYPG